MREIYERRQSEKNLASLPAEILKRYEKWKDIVRLSGPTGLRLIKSFHDEALKGKWQGFRSSRLGLQYRVIYEIDQQRVWVKVFDINPHDYRR